MKQYTIITEEKISKNKNSLLPNMDVVNLTSVFKNDELQQVNEDYLVENNEIVFNTNLNKDDTIKLVYDYNTNNNLINPGKSNSNSILTRFNSDIKLNDNNKYTIGIAIDKDVYEWSFNSKRNPMFSSSKKILEDIGEFIEGFTEEYINSKIYDNSLEVINLIDELKENDIENVTYETDENGNYTTSYKAINNWVRYKTDIELTLAKYFGISYHYGSELKEIGDIKIEKTTKLPYIDNLLDALKRKFELADEAIRGKNSVKSAVKAGTTYKYDDWDRDTTW